MSKLPEGRTPLTDDQLKGLAGIDQKARADAVSDATFYIDCEFDGHCGPLLSIAMVRENGDSIYITVIEEATNTWVVDNVVPVLSAHNAKHSHNVGPEDVGPFLRFFMGDCQNPTIIADSPVDIGRFCRAISTGFDGGWQSTDFPKMTFIVQNVDCYPTKLEGAVQHNAWWDAMALRTTLAELTGGKDE